MKEKNYLDKNGRIPTYRVQDEYNIMENLDDNKPSKRIIKTKKGLNAIKALIDIEKNSNISWYEYLKQKNINNMEELALFYRGNKISFKKMFDIADKVAFSMREYGLSQNDEIGVCVSNTPELVYIILAANKLGVKVNCFGANFNRDYISSILNDVNTKLIFVSDDNYEKLENVILNSKIENIIMTSLSDSLPIDPTMCDEYEKDLDEYYYYDNLVNVFKKLNSNIRSFNEFINVQDNKYKNIKSVGDLETDFLITYTSGSTKVGLPKQIVHKNRSLITMGRFHDPELSGNPKIRGLRGLAHIHSDSNTNIITCISDNLMQGWSVALEPEYDEKKALDYVILNKPNYFNATTSFLIAISKQYLVEKKYNKSNFKKKLPFLLAAFAVGEKTQPGEEKFINQFLRESRAGSGISIKGIKLPFTTLSVGGGDCEHGGIYYTLWKTLFEKLYSPILKKESMGMLPVPFAVVTALKKDKENNYVECNYDELGILVANSYTNLSGYKNNISATQDLILTDNLGRNWVTCNVYGYIDKIGGVHIKDRISTNQLNMCPNYLIDEIVTKDTKNILSSSTVDVENCKVINIQFQPLSKVSSNIVLKSMYERLNNYFSYDIVDKIFVRIIPTKESFPLTGSGKRNVKELEQMKFDNCIKISNCQIEKSSEKVKKLIKQ